MKTSFLNSLRSTVLSPRRRLLAKTRTLAALAAALGLASAAHSDPMRVGSLTIDPAAAPASGPVTVELHAIGDPADETDLGVFTLRPGSASWQWRIGPAGASGERVQMDLSPGNTLTLLHPVSGASSIVLSPGDAEETAPAISLSDGGGHTIVLRPGGVPADAITVNGLPLFTAEQASAAFLTPAQAAAAYLPLHPAVFVAGLGAVADSPGAFVFAEGGRARTSGQFIAGSWNALEGDPTIAPWDYSHMFIIGNGTDDTHRSDAFVVRRNGFATLAHSLDIGPGCDVTGIGSIAVGNGAHTLGESSISVGTWAWATELCSVALGGWTSARAYGSVSLGGGSIAHHAYTTASGFATNAIGEESFAAGQASVAAGVASFAGGSSGAEAHYSTSFGLGTKARSYGQTALGRFNLPQGDPFQGSANPGDDLFILGNGVSDTARSNAFTVTSSGDVRAAGVIRVKAAGDLSMGPFSAGPRPEPNPQP